MTGNRAFLVTTNANNRWAIISGQYPSLRDTRSAGIACTYMYITCSIQRTVLQGFDMPPEQVRHLYKLTKRQQSTEQALITAFSCVSTQHAVFWKWTIAAAVCGGAETFCELWIWGSVYRTYISITLCTPGFAHSVIVILELAINIWKSPKSMRLPTEITVQNNWIRFHDYK